MEYRRNKQTGLVEQWEDGKKVGEVTHISVTEPSVADPEKKVAKKRPNKKSQ